MSHLVIETVFLLRVTIFPTYSLLNVLADLIFLTLQFRTVSKYVRVDCKMRFSFGIYALYLNFR